MKASNRQKKLLNFFGIPHSESTTAGAAGWEIGQLFFDPANRERWERYVYLTKDLGGDSPDLLPFDRAELESIEIPAGWNESAEVRKLREELVEQTMQSEGPFDSPPPSIEFAGKTFMFTGKFDFGSRKDCETAVVERGGKPAPTKTVSPDLDFLVIGSGGSKAWKRESYGSKIEKAILCRREHGVPAIVSEDEWVKSFQE